MEASWVDPELEVDLAHQRIVFGLDSIKMRLGVAYHVKVHEDYGSFVAFGPVGLGVLQELHSRLIPYQDERREFIGV